MQKAHHSITNNQGSRHTKSHICNKIIIPHVGSQLSIHHSFI